jgi:hypothetical protein
LTSARDSHTSTSPSPRACKRHLLREHLVSTHRPRDRLTGRLLDQPAAAVEEALRSEDVDVAEEEAVPTALHLLLPLPLRRLLQLPQRLLLAPLHEV